MRKVTYFLTTNNEKKEIMSAASTWGDLKSQLGISADLKFVLKETRVTLESSEAILPNTEITIFGFAKKNKSGAVDSQEIAEMLSALRSEVNERIDAIMIELTGNSEIESNERPLSWEEQSLLDDAQDIIDSLED
jgi:hypothetical protein